MNAMTPRHEAGHLIAAYLLGEELVSATVVPTATYAGEIRHQAADGTAPTPARDRAIITIALAGRAACRHYARAGSGCQEDDANAWQQARAIVGDDPADAPKVGALVAECWLEAQGLADDWHQAITDVARDLALLGTVEGEALTRTVAAAIERDRASPWCEQQRQRRREALALIAEYSKGDDHGHAHSFHPVAGIAPCAAGASGRRARSPGDPGALGGGRSHGGGGDDPGGA